MTEHLPECWATHPSDPPAWCICDELRACEERVTKRWEDLRGWGETHAFKSGKDSGWEDGLYAAREAVAALATERELRSPSSLDIDIHEAIAAIDARRDPVP